MSSPNAFVPRSLVSGRARLLALMLVAAGTGHVVAQATPSAVGVPVASVDNLLAGFARLGALRAKFREEKRIALFRTPLLSSGDVHFTRPGWISRSTERPEASVVLLKDGQLTVTDPAGRRVVDVTASPLLRAFVEGFVHVLSGDHAALERNYSLQFTAETEQPWRLDLRPKVEGLAKFVTLLTFEGHGSVVQRMTLREGNGDETVTEFSHVQLMTELPAGERARLFSVPR